MWSRISCSIILQHTQLKLYNGSVYSYLYLMLVLFYKQQLPQL